MKIKNLKKLFSTTILSICFIVSIIPTVGAVSDDETTTEPTLEARKIEIVDSATTLFHTLGGDEVATLNNNIVTLNCDVMLKNSIDIYGQDSIILDLNGHIVSTNNSKLSFNKGYIFSIKEGADLTIKDTFNLGAIEDKNIASYALSLDGGNLTIDGGNIYDVIAYEGNLVINSGRIFTSSYFHSYSLYIDGNNGSNLTGIINGGLINGVCVSKGNLVINSGCIFSGSAGNSLKLDNEYGSVTINNGLVRGNNGTGILANNGHLTLNDGIINGFDTGIQCNSKSEVEIRGGQIIGNNTGIKLYANKAYISGGTFQSDNNAIVCNVPMGRFIKKGCNLVDKAGNDIDLFKSSCQGFAKVV